MCQLNRYICIGYFLPTFGGYITVGGCLCALRALGWETCVSRINIFVLDIFCQHLGDIWQLEGVCAPFGRWVGKERERERFISSHDIGYIFSYKLRYFRQTCGAYMVNTDLLPAAPQIAILSSFFLAGLPDSKSQLMEQIVLSIMMFCLGGSHQSLVMFCSNLKNVFKMFSNRNSSSILIQTRYA